MKNYIFRGYQQLLIFFTRVYIYIYIFGMLSIFFHECGECRCIRFENKELWMRIYYSFFILGMGMHYFFKRHFPNNEFSWQTTNCNTQIVKTRNRLNKKNLFCAGNSNLKYEEPAKTEIVRNSWNDFALYSMRIITEQLWIINFIGDNMMTDLVVVFTECHRLSTLFFFKHFQNFLRISQSRGRLLTLPS